MQLHWMSKAICDGTKYISIGMPIIFVKSGVNKDIMVYVKDTYC